jgi:alpha/beta superfamily hydrolase
VYWELAKQGIAVLRFNFRGVGNSGGSFGGGVAEVRDVRAAINFALSQPGIDTESLGLVGYSFGGGVSVRETAGDNQVKVLALISPQLDELAWQMLEKNTKPKLFVVGSEDEQFPLVQYEANLKTVPEPKEFHIVKGADHYWAGYETELAGQVGRFFTENLKI